MTTTINGKATDLITFSRGSLATVTDSNGLIKWAPHNLLLASEQFDNTNWTKSSATVAANTEEAPNGTDTADTITASGANGTALQSYTALAVPYTFGVWLKRKTGTGTIEIAADNGTYTAVTITSDWALYTVTQTPAAGSKSAGIRIVTSADEVYAWGAHLYRSDLGGMQANASAYPYYNPSTPKNLLGYSEAFDSAFWTKASGVSVVANADAAPNGSPTADQVTFASGGASEFLRQPISMVVNTTYTFSVYARLVSGSATFTVDYGNIGTSSTLTPTSVWQRFSYTFTFTGSNNWIDIQVSAGCTIAFWGAQLSDSASLDPYVPNFGAAPSAAAYHGPRLDYDGDTLAARGLLVEEARTNAVIHSSDFASWSGSTATVNANAVVAPDGTQTADEVVRVSSVSDNKHINCTFTGDGSKPVSIYVKYNTASTFTVLLFDLTVIASRADVTFTFTAGVPTATSTLAGSVESIQAVGNGWYRIKLVASGVVAANTNRVYVYPAVAGSSDGEKTTFWGAQAEVQTATFSTSYIATSGAQITRNADVASVGTSQFPYSASEGTLVVAWMAGRTSGPAPALVLDDTDSTQYSNVVFMNQGNSAGAGSGWRAIGNVSGISQFDFDVASPALAVGSTYKLALALKQNDFAAVLNGGTVQTDPTGSVPQGIDLLRIGGHRDGTNINGWIRQITYIPRRLTNAELQSRTA